MRASGPCTEWLVTTIENMIERERTSLRGLFNMNMRIFILFAGSLIAATVCK